MIYKKNKCDRYSLVIDSELYFPEPSVFNLDAEGIL